MLCVLCKECVVYLAPPRREDRGSMENAAAAGAKCLRARIIESMDHRRRERHTKEYCTYNDRDRMRKARLGEVASEKQEKKKEWSRIQ